MRPSLVVCSNLNKWYRTYRALKPSVFFPSLLQATKKTRAFAPCLPYCPFSSRRYQALACHHPVHSAIVLRPIASDMIRVYYTPPLAIISFLMICYCTYNNDRGWNGNAISCLRRDVRSVQTWPSSRHTLQSTPMLRTRKKPAFMSLSSRRPDVTQPKMPSTLRRKMHMPKISYSRSTPDS